MYAFLLLTGAVCLGIVLEVLRGNYRKRPDGLYLFFTDVGWAVFCIVLFMLFKPRL